MQRRLASSVRAIRRTLERRLERIEGALADPEGYLRRRKSFQAAVLPDVDDIEDLDESDLWRLEDKALDEWLPTPSPNSTWNDRRSGLCSLRHRTWRTAERTT